MIENVLIIDTETTGLNPSNGDKLIEIGAMLYNVKHKVVLQTFSTFLPCAENHAEDINGIKAEHTNLPMSLTHVTAWLSSMCSSAQALVAHNASFDKKFLETLDPQPRVRFSEKKWICTKHDFKWPVQLFRNRLQDICEAMGVPYVNAHRALNDCNFLVQCFNKVDDLEDRMNRAVSNKFDVEVYR
jgi:DNA polymerase-3 subunit epsilon